MGSIELLLDSEKIAIDEKNFSESMAKIDKALTPGVLVMIQNHTLNDVGGFSNRNGYNTTALFFSEGNIKEEKFDIQKGKENYTYINLNELNNPDSYQIVNNGRDSILDYVNIIIPHSWLGTAFNEGTFSRSGGTSWTTRHAKGTRKIIIGDSLLEQFPDAVNALKFARDAQYFRLNGAYSHQNNLIMKNGDNVHNNSYNITDLKKEFSTLPDKIVTNEEKLKYLKLRKKITIAQENSRDEETHEIACVRAALNLLYEPSRDSTKNNNVLQAIELGLFRNGVEAYQEKGYPVDKKDYIIKEIQHPNRTIAFVKTGKGIAYGDMYILPAKNMEDIVKAAFSVEHVKKYYPYGF